MTTINTSNGPLALGGDKAVFTKRGISVTLETVTPLDRPEEGYTHSVGYHGLDGDGGVVGSTLVTAADAEIVKGYIAVE